MHDRVASTGAMAAQDVRPLNADDVRDVARVHMAAFPRQALTRLGPDLVERYYHWLLTGPHDVAAFGWRADGRLLGFVVAGRFRRALSGFVHHNRGRLIMRVLTRPLLLANPLVRARVDTAWRWALRRNLPDAGPEPSERSSFGVLAIAVLPSAEGRGGGRALLEAAEAAARARGCRRLHLTVEPDNARAIKFYERTGWSKHVEASGWNGLMEKDLASPPALPQPRSADPTRS